MEKCIQARGDRCNEFDSDLCVFSVVASGLIDAAVCPGADIQYGQGDLRFSGEQQLRLLGYRREQGWKSYEREQVYCQSYYGRDLSMIYSGATMFAPSTMRAIRVCVGVMTATIVVVSFAFPAMADTIDATDQYSWGENVGWLVWGTTEGDVFVPDSATDGELTGYVWGENVGWISLNCSNTLSCGAVDYSVDRDQGNVTGYAWGENIGWVNFNCSNNASCGTVDFGVSIATTSGEFSGYAWGENIGWVNFNCSNDVSCGIVDFKVLAVPTATSTPSPGGGGVQISPWLLVTVSPSVSPTVSPTPIATGAPVVVPPAAPSASDVSPPPSGPPPGAPSAPPPAPGVPGMIDRISRRIDVSLDRIFGRPVESGAGIVTAFALAPLLWAAFEIVQTESAGAVAFSFFQAVGLKKKPRVWGTVYDSHTKHPVPFARVQILDEANRVLENRFTDRDGHYGFPLHPPSENESTLRVRIVAAKSGYGFPSKVVTSGTDYFVYERVYTGDVIDVSSDTALTYNIPMDPFVVEGGPARPPFAAVISKSWETVLNIGFYAGFVLVPYNMILHPTMPNFIIGVIFFAANAYRIFKIYRPYGHVNDVSTGQKIPFSLVTLHDESGKRLSFSVSDEVGRYFLSTHEAQHYQVRVHTPANIIPPRSTTEDISRHSKHIKRGWITKDMRV